ncbi:MAG: hypothetical protein ABI591_11235 [Kofleriaceae bacterium]
MRRCHAPARDATTTHELVALPAQQNHELDVLFVLDNEVSTADHQVNLRLAVPALVSAISLDGPPDLHLGVITPELGSSTVNGIGPTIGGASQGGCSATGDRGELYMHRFATDPADVAQLFAVGSNGCGFQQPLAAMRAALTSPSNVGFRRPKRRSA